MLAQRGPQRGTTPSWSTKAEGCDGCVSRLATGIICLPRSPPKAFATTSPVAAISSPFRPLEEVIPKPIWATNALFIVLFGPVRLIRSWLEIPFRVLVFLWTISKNYSCR